MDGEMLPPLPASSPAEAPSSASKARSATPAKNSKKRTSSAKITESDDDNVSAKKAKTDSQAGTPVPTPTPRKRKATGKEPLKAMQMGKTFDLCQDHDKMLLEWKDGGRTWTDIRKKWKDMTGDTTAISTLPNRYSRLKSNFVVIKEEHNAILLECKQEVEASYEREKWHLIGKAMEQKGADSYKPVELHRQYKNLLRMGAELKAERDGLIPSTPSPALRTTAKGKGKKAVKYDEVEADGGDEMEEY